MLKKKTFTAQVWDNNHPNSVCEEYKAHPPTGSCYPNKKRRQELYIAAFDDLWSLSISKSSES